MKKVFLSVIYLVAFLVGGISVSQAQIAHGGEPLFNGTKSNVELVKLDAIDNNKYLQEDMTAVKGSAMRVGVVRNVNISNREQGTITTLADGTRVWRIQVASPNAKFMMLHFSTFDIPEGAHLFVYDASGEFVIGGFTNENTHEGNIFYTQAIPGSEITVEYQEPASVAGQGHLVIDQVTHGYKEFFKHLFDEVKGPLGDSEGNCHINVVCPEADDWRDQVRSVVCYQITAGPYVFSCSGALINNTNQDRTPLVLSAHHCQDLSQYGSINGWVTYFNYQTNRCDGGSGPYNKSITGATILAKKSGSGGSDFMLFKLSRSIPNAYQPYYAGWDRSSADPTKGACIHHPGGDYKKISIPRVVEKNSGSYSKFFSTYWYTGANNKGVTEQGSSGSPLFNADKRIIGQLYAGSSACDNMGGYDLYGRVYSSWSGGGTEDTRLKDHLDPTNSGVQQLDGLNYKDEDPVSISEADAVQMKVYPNPSTGMFYIDIEETGMANFKVYSMDGRCVKEGRTVLTTTTQGINLSGIARGAYRLILFTSDKAYSANIIKK